MVQAYVYFMNQSFNPVHRNAVFVVTNDLQRKRGAETT